MLSGEEKLFAIDGQPRVIGIKKALLENPVLGSDQISAIFVAHRRDEVGQVRTRRLFTRLNRYAKAVTSYEKIALDEDDVIAIIVRRLVNDYPLFQDKRISSTRGTSIPKQDRYSLTTLVFLYKVLDFLLKHSKSELIKLHHDLSLKPEVQITRWSDFKRYRPDQRVIDYFYTRSVEFWDLMVQEFEALSIFLGSSGVDLAYHFRHENGGHLLFRPIGLEVVIKVVRYLIDVQYTLQEAVTMVSNCPMILSKAPWVGLLWDEKNQRMLTDATNRKITVQLLFFLTAGDLSLLEREKTDYEQLKTELAGVLNREPDEISNYFRL